MVDSGRRTAPETKLTAAIVAILAATAAALPLVRWVAPSVAPRTLLGASILLGLGFAATTLLLLAIFGISWSPAAVAVIFLPFSAAGLVIRRNLAQTETGRNSRVALVLEVLAYLPLLGFSRFATAAPPWIGDFWSDWGLKARAFLEHRGIDWTFLARPDNAYAHPGYPPLLPLLFDYLALAAGRWNEWVVPPLYVVVAIALLLISYDRAYRDFGSPVLGSAALLILVNFSVTPWIGYADGILLSFGSAAVLLIREALQRSDSRLLTLGAVILGFAATLKNEGAALLVSCAIATLMHDRFRWHRIVRLWPAVILPAAWLVIKLPYGLGVFLAQGDVGGRVVERLTNPNEWRGVVAGRHLVPYREEVWLAALVAIAVAGLRFARKERFVLTVIPLQIALCFAAYLATPWSVRFHIANSWQRITAQLTFLVGYVGLLAAAEVLMRFARIRRAPAAGESLVEG